MPPLSRTDGPRGPSRAPGCRLAVAAALLVLACRPGAPEPAPEPVDVPTPAAERAGDAERPAPVAVAVPVPAAGPVAGAPRGVVPYRGPLPPSDPPLRLPPGERPLDAPTLAALDVLYERPSPEGPPPIPVPVPKAIYAEGRGPIIRVLPGPMPYIAHVPPALRTALPEKGPFSNNVVRLQEGTVRFVAVDRTLNDTKLTRDSMALELSFVDEHGDRWRIVQASLAPLSPMPANEPWLGGLAIDTVYHGESGRGIAAEPRLNCAMCSWGWADVWKNDTKVQSAAPLHMMLSSAVRAGAERNFEYQCYDCTANPVREIHAIVGPAASLPTPGGFLHVMWEQATVRRGTPEEIVASAPQLEEVMPTLMLRAVPYLAWSDTTIHVVAGRRYRLVLQNDDPTSDHAFNLHMSGEGHMHGGGGEGGGHAGHAGHHTDAAGSTDMPWRAPSDALPSAADLVHVPLPHGSRWATTIEFSKTGTYHFGCPVMNHENRGMHGRFVVSAPSDSTGGRP